MWFSLVHVFMWRFNIYETSSEKWFLSSHVSACAVMHTMKLFCLVHSVSNFHWNEWEPSWSAVSSYYNTFMATNRGQTKRIETLTTGWETDVFDITHSFTQSKTSENSNRCDRKQNNSENEPVETCWWRMMDEFLMQNQTVLDFFSTQMDVCSLWRHPITAEEHTAGPGSD